MINLLWALPLAFAVIYGARYYVIKRMLESYELGLKMGRLGNAMGQDWLDAQLRATGLDPTKLPGRADRR